MLSKSTIKYIQSLQHKKFRNEHNAFIAEGPKVVLELLKANKFQCKSIYALEKWVNELDPVVAQRVQQNIIIVRDFELKKIAAFYTANNVVGIFEQRSTDANVSLANEITLVLDDLQDPGNFGTIIRTADWFGVKNIVCSENTVDVYNAKVVQSTMASLSHVNILYTDLPLWLKTTAGIPKFAAVIDGGHVNQIKKIKEAILIIGNESKGISPGIIASVTRKITIPKSGNAESLNAAVAAGILLYVLKSLTETV